MTKISRRKFIIGSVCAAAALPLRMSAVSSPNNRVRVVMIGCGIRSRLLLDQFLKIKDCEIVAICDPDTVQMGKLMKRLAPAADSLSTEVVGQYQDYRKLLEWKDIDAVVISSPNHWHVMHSIDAMQAGKDVYLEKPVSHSLWEGQQLVAAEKKFGRVIAAGYQNRSDPGPIEGIRYVQEGNLGKILSVHVCCFRNRDSIGNRLAQPLTPPASCDYNLWLGPAQDQPIYRPQLHYDWHWIWNTGNGDIGNQAPHEIDMACWVTNGDQLPVEMNSFGNRFAWEDAGETPNMQVAWYKMNGIPCVVEVNNLKISPERNVEGIRDGVRVGIVVKCEGGELRGGRGGMYVVGADGKTKVKKFPGDGGADHQQNFIDAVRTRNSSNLRSRIESAEYSSAISHLANLSLRTGTLQAEDAVSEAIGDNSVLHTILDDQAKQLQAWGIDQPEYRLGQSLKVNQQYASLKGDGIAELVRPPQRQEFAVPELV